MRILHVVASIAARTGGPAVSVVGLSKALQDRGETVAIFATDFVTSASATSPRGGVTLSDMPVGAAGLDIFTFRVRPPYRFAFCPGLAVALRNHVHEYDVIHIHSLNLFPQLVAWRAAVRSSVPFVVSPRGALDPWVLRQRRLRKTIVNRLWQRRMLNAATALHLTTSEERSLIEPMNIRTNTVVIPNGLDLAKYREPASGAAFRKQFLDGFTGPLVLNHGRIDRKKGLDVLIAAVARAKETIPTLRLALVGPDETGLCSTLTRQAEGLGIANSVIFTGPLFGEQMRQALAATDVWALPSHGENFGVAVVEAMAACLPVVTSPHVNLAPNAHMHGALRVVANEPTLLASELVDLLTNQSTSKQLAMAGCDYAQRFEWASLAVEYQTMYRTAIDAGQTRHTKNVLSRDRKFERSTAE